MDKIKIIPAALGRDENELKLQMDKIAPLCGELHTDYGDGEFVDSKTVDWSVLLDLPEYYPNNQLELHIMAYDPVAIAKAAFDRGFVRTIIHLEALGQNGVVEVEELARRGSVYLALNLDTQVELAKSYFNVVDGITLMSIIAGGQGREFKPKVIDKIKKLRASGYKKTIEVDGGVNLATIERVVRAGADRLVVGSAIVGAEEPKKVYDEMFKKM